MRRELLGRARAFAARGFASRAFRAPARTAPAFKSAATKCGFWPRPHSLRGRFTIANVTFLAVGLLLAACASIAATYMVLVGEIDDSLKGSQKSLARTVISADTLRQLCQLADLLQSGPNAQTGQGSSAVAVAFQQDLFVLLDKHGEPAAVCQDGTMPVSAEQRRLADAIPDAAGLARGGGAKTVKTGHMEYRVVALRLSDGTIVVKGIRLSGVKHAIGNLLIVESVVGVVLLALLATGSLTAARRRLSPLEDMVATASAIAEGDLGRRIGTARHGSSEVEQLSSALNAMLQQIETAVTESERATTQLRRFLADASHELRTPLASVRGYLQLYEKDMLDPAEKDRALSRVSSETLRMSRLVDELLALARLDDRPPLPHCAVDLPRLVRDAAADLAAQQPERPLTLMIPERAADGGPLPEALGDEAALRQVVGNLLSNVRVHTPPRSPVSIEVAERGGRLLLRITDSGPGLGEEDAARVFDRFFRADPERSRDTGGAGLGMSIVQAVVRAHRGTVALDTAPGRGLTVCVTLPTVPAVPEIASASTSGAALPATT
ncbi:two-component system, OmpR family, sensor kinase [Actinacidiphila alni]|uniref:histidine kinase n=1 Tax=Actinacidiphila alni TaxID=380248 RepID=A0A1I2DPB8_9ACTN|nr:HAMP domain-containing sensor histidine kinase [Actinacidiphila alni]SFE82462.1 two-component system, OmpR family, sensor kinase [Actinacidiphila alni]